MFGSAKIAGIYAALLRHREGHTDVAPSVELITVNGLPALLCTDPDPPPGGAPRWMFRVEVRADGRVTDIHSILAPEKLAGVTERSIH